MAHAFRPAEIVVIFMPVVLVLAAVVVLPLPDKPVYDLTHSGKRYRKVDPPTHVHLLETRTFWLVYALAFGGAIGWALYEALSSAVLTGMVSLPGTKRSPRPVVPWHAGWAYFLSLASLLLAVALPWTTRRHSTHRALAQVAAGLLGFLGYFTLLISAPLSDWRIVVFLAISLAGVTAYGYWRLTKVKILNQTLGG